MGIYFRNLPKDISAIKAGDIDSHSGLELKICVNTYKIFFVDNTEDYFFRRAGKQPALLEQKRDARNKRFDAWYNGEDGWNRGSEGDPSGIDAWFLNGPADESEESMDEREAIVVSCEERGGREVRVFQRVPAPVEAIGGMEIDS